MTELEATITIPGPSGQEDPIPTFRADQLAYELSQLNGAAPYQDEIGNWQSAFRIDEIDEGSGQVVISARGYISNADIVAAVHSHVPDDEWVDPNAPPP